MIVIVAKLIPLLHNYSKKKKKKKQGRWGLCLPSSLSSYLPKLLFPDLEY